MRPENNPFFAAKPVGQALVILIYDIRFTRPHEWGKVS